VYTAAVAADAVNAIPDAPTASAKWFANFMASAPNE
jgi:hypothetical protein